MKYIDSYQIFESKHDVNIREKLENGYCEFYYRKSDGSKRHAFGTLKPAFLKKVWKPKRNDKSSEVENTGFIKYFDIVKKEFRQFHKDMFIGLEYETETLKQFIEKFPELDKKVKKAKKSLIESETDSKEKEEDKKTEK